ncbi:MAG: hypothetical protein KAR12_03940 [Methylococcales bacterium]|nr:hypothetical protein [Methylococcales bacterium]
MVKIVRFFENKEIAEQIKPEIFNGRHTNEYGSGTQNQSFEVIYFFNGTASIAGSIEQPIISPKVLLI